MPREYLNLDVIHPTAFLDSETVARLDEELRVQSTWEPPEFSPLTRT